MRIVLNNNIQLRYTKKIRKYTKLKQEILTVWRVKRVTIHLTVIILVFVACDFKVRK